MSAMTEEDVCPICLDVLHDGTTDVFECGHVVHTTCFADLVKSRCPTERRLWSRPMKCGKPFAKKGSCEMIIGDDLHIPCPMCRVPHTIFTDGNMECDGKDTFRVHITAPRRLRGRVWFRDVNTDLISPTCHHITCERDMLHYFTSSELKKFSRGLTSELSRQAKALLYLYEAFMDKSDNILDLHAIKCSKHCKDNGCLGICLHPSPYCQACTFPTIYKHASVEEIARSWWLR
jgi:hypothetical protein